MPIDKNIWVERFTSDDFPDWVCPTCAVGRIKIDKHKLHYSESALSRKENSVNTPWSEGVFSASFICNNGRCRESVIINGIYEVREDYEFDEIYDQPVLVYSHFFRPLTSCPTLHVFQVPDYVPSIVAESIVDSFKTFWLDPSSCANRIRTAVEAIMNQQKIKKIIITKTGKRSFLSLHERLKSFEKKRQDLAKKLEAIKWIGNAGSHSKQISTEHLIDAYDILHNVIVCLYETESRRIEKLSNAIVAKKKPISKSVGKTKK